jgi:hypothetical protein
MKPDIGAHSNFSQNQAAITGTLHMFLHSPGWIIPRPFINFKGQILANATELFATCKFPNLFHFTGNRWA